MIGIKTKMLKYNLSIAILALGLFGSCKEEEKALLPDPTDISMKYDLPKAKFIAQLAVAERATAEWSVFNEFKSNLASLSDANLERLRSQTSKLTMFSDSLVKHVPASLSSLPIKSRMDVVHARIELLEQSSSSWAVDSLELKENYQEVILAFNVLLHQINEKFEKEAIQKQEADNFSHELQQRTRDSIFEIEKNRGNR